MPHWMCTSCGFLVSEEDPPEHCDGCNRAADFNDVTCYRPECGGEANVDPLLIGATLRAIGRKGGPAGQASKKPPPELPEHIEAVAIFRDLSEEQISMILALSEKETFPPGTTVFHQGDEANRLYIVDSGRVAINTSIQDGKWAPVCIVSSGGVFGWSCLVPPYQLTASATTFEETTVTRFDRSALKELFTQEPAIGYVMIQNVGGLISSRLKNVRLELIGVVFM
jgi:CRP/FNR family cyclic AMP-dependent transcriptional regulator